eukprot:gene10255-437_t
MFAINRAKSGALTIAAVTSGTADAASTQDVLPVRYTPGFKTMANCTPHTTTTPGCNPR